MCCFDDLTVTCLCHLASVPPRQLHRLPQRCPSGTEVLSVCCYPPHSTCPKGKRELWFSISIPQLSHSFECQVIFIAVCSSCWGP